MMSFRFPSPEKPWHWTGLIILLRLPILAYFIWQGHLLFPERMMADFVLQEVDYGYFLGPVDNYFETGNYEYTPGEPYAGRMPGYAIPYFLLRLILSQTLAIQLLIILQVILSAVSVYYLARMAQEIVRSETAFYLTLILYGTSLYYLRYDFCTITEGPSVALFILAMHHLFRFWGAWRPRNLIWAGTFITWAIFLRPFIGYLLVPIGVMLLIEGWKQSGWSRLYFVRPALIFCIPFILIEGAWIARNQVAFDEFIPLETPLHESYGKAYSKSWLALRDLSAALDIERAYFEAGLAWWFRIAEEDEATAYTMPEDWFDGVSFTRSDLEELRKDYRAYRAEGEAMLYEPMDERIAAEANALEKQIAQARPMQYHLWNRLKNIQRRVFTSGSSYVLLPPFHEMSLFQKSLKLWASFCYYFVGIFGLFGLFRLALVGKESRFRNLGALTLIHVIGLPVLLSIFPSTLENRYLFTLYPILFLGTVHTIAYILGVSRKSRWIP